MYAKLKQNKRAIGILEFIGGLFTSGFVGLGTFMLLDSLHQQPGFCAACAGVGGHMATRLLTAVERRVLSDVSKP